MKTTEYFKYTRQRPDRASIKDEWIEFVIENPDVTEIPKFQSFGVKSFESFKFWGQVTIHNPQPTQAEIARYLKVSAVMISKVFRGVE